MCSPPDTVGTWIHRLPEFVLHHFKPWVSKGRQIVMDHHHRDRDNLFVNLKDGAPFDRRRSSEFSMAIALRGSHKETQTSRRKSLGRSHRSKQSSIDLFLPLVAGCWVLSVGLSQRKSSKQGYIVSCGSPNSHTFLPRID